MKLYRFSPITSKSTLFEAIKHIHVSSYTLCYNSFWKYLKNAGNIGIFCHYDEEYNTLKSIQTELVYPSDNPNQKYYTLKTPITIPEENNIPEATYTHLYIRKPDPYRHHVGDLDFFLEESFYRKVKQDLLGGKITSWARVFERKDLDMIELYNPDIDVLAYMSTEKMTQNVRVKISEETNL